MWKILAGAAFALLSAAGLTALYLKDRVYPHFEHAEVTRADFSKAYSAQQLRADFLFMTRMIEHVHPDIAAITKEPEYSERKREIAAQLTRPMTRTEFFRLIGGLNSQYADGHTLAVSPSEEWAASSARARTLPWLMRLDGDRTLIVQDLHSTEVPEGSQLIALNGIPALDLQRQMVARVSGESADYRASYAAQIYPRLLWELGLKSPWTLTYQAPQSSSNATVSDPGISLGDWEATEGHPVGQPYRITIDDHVATLSINDFDSRLYGDFRAFAKTAFTRIRDAGVDSVILDLRECDGGDTRLSDELQRYLSRDFLPAIASVSTKASPEVKAMYRSLLPPGFRWIPLNSMVPQLAAIQKATDDSMVIDHPDGAAPTRRKHAEPLVFTGQLIVLISPNTYSTCLIAAAPYKYWKRATFIGEPSGEALAFFGDYYQFDLPNTKLQARVSHKMFRLVGATGRPLPLQPDILVDRAKLDAHAIALEEIRLKRARGQRDQPARHDR